MSKFDAKSHDDHDLPTDHLQLRNHFVVRRISIDGAEVIVLDERGPGGTIRWSLVTREAALQLAEHLKLAAEAGDLDAREGQ